MMDDNLNGRTEGLIFILRKCGYDKEARTLASDVTYYVSSER
jgi:hypothetical protein